MSLAAIVLLVAAAEGAVAAESDVAALIRRGFALNQRSDLEEARACFEQALAASLRTGDARAEAEARRGLGSTLYGLRFLDDAQRHLDVALVLFEAHDDPLGAARTRLHLGSVAAVRRETGKARALYEQAQAAFESIGAEAARDRALVLYNLGFVVPEGERMGKTAEALAAARAAGDRLTEGRVLQRLGDMATRSGRYVDAAARYRDAESCFTEVGARQPHARLLVSQSRLYLAQGDIERSMTLAAQALRLHERAGDAEGVVLSLDYLSTAASRQGRHRDALRHFARARRWAASRGDPRLVHLVDARSAEAHVRIGAYARAVRLLERALPSLQNDPVEAGGYDWLAQAHHARGRYAAALAAAERAVALSRERGQPLFAVLETRARCHERLGRTEAALHDVREAIDAVEQARARVLPSDSLKQKYAERHQELFGHAIELLTASNRHEEAFAMAEQARARALQDLLSARAEGGEAAVASADAADDSPASTPSLTLTETADTARRLCSSIVSYWVGPRATFVWLVDGSGTLHARRIVVREARLRALVRQTLTRPRLLRERSLGGRAAPTTPDASDGAWRELYARLIAPIEPRLPPGKEGRLTIVPHGPLFHLSFAGLRDTRGRYLLERVALHYVPAAGVLRFTQPDGQDATAHTPSVLLVADPRLPRRLPDGSPAPPLPAARLEAAAIRRLLPGHTVTLLTGAAATEVEVRRRLPHQHVVHFATHGVTRDDAPLDAFVALAGGGEGPDGDGRLSAREVHGLRLRADLVFLSACRSGRGRPTADGILGLTRAFVSAGASSVVAALWDVADDPAADLVPTFYAARERGADKIDALRAAQLRLLRRLRAGRVAIRTPDARLVLEEDPALWAGFLLVGAP